MPEEINRIMCDHSSTLLFSPTETGYQNLIKEGFSKTCKSKRPLPMNPISTTAEMSCMIIVYIFPN